MSLKSKEVSLGTQVTQRYCNGFIILFTQTMQTKHFSPYSPLDKYRNTTAGLQGLGSREQVRTVLPGGGQRTEGSAADEGKVQFHSCLTLMAPPILVPCWSILFS